LSGVTNNGSQSIYWYDQWLETGDRTFLDIIQRYRDDCRATRHVKDWLGNFIRSWNSFKRGIPNYCPQVGEIQHWHDSNPAHRWHSLNSIRLLHQ